MNDEKLEAKKSADRAVAYREQLERQQFLNDEEKAVLFFKCLVAGDSTCARMLDRYEVLLWIMGSVKKGVPHADEAFRFARRKIRNSTKARAYAERLELPLYDETEGA